MTFAFEDASCICTITFYGSIDLGSITCIRDTCVFGTRLTGGLLQDGIALYRIALLKLICFEDLWVTVTSLCYFVAIILSYFLLYGGAKTYFGCDGQGGISIYVGGLYRAGLFTGSAFFRYFFLL